MKKTDNITFHDGYIEVALKPSIYPLDVVFNAAYVLLDEAYVLVDGDPSANLLVRLRPKSSTDLAALAQRFNEELISYSVYKQQSEKHRALREELLKRALLTNLVTEEDDYQKDEEGILIPWEEKYGKDA